MDETERQVERGSLFTHTVLSTLSQRLDEAEAFLFGLIDVLVGRGAVREDEILAAATRVRDTNDQVPSPAIVLRVDADQPVVEPQIDCAARLPVCGAVCCKLHFALSAPEVEAGAVRWDLGSPYAIRQDETGCCVHREAVTHRCTIYADRPRVCRSYSCEGDGRIWKDFEAMVLNEEWLSTHLGPTRPRLAAAQMIPVEVASVEDGLADG